jgi:hypothetical protein
VEPVRFWSDPSRDKILQEEAYRVLDWFTNRYDIADTSHLELCRMDLSLEGSGRSHVTGASERSEDPVA